MGNGDGERERDSGRTREEEVVEELVCVETGSFVVTVDGVLGRRRIRIRRRANRAVGVLDDTEDFSPDGRSEVDDERTILMCSVGGEGAPVAGLTRRSPTTFSTGARSDLRILGRRPRQGMGNESRPVARGIQLRRSSLARHRLGERACRGGS